MVEKRFLDEIKLASEDTEKTFSLYYCLIKVYIHETFKMNGGVVVSTVTSQQSVPGSIPTWGLSVWSLHVLPVYAWVLSGYSGFLPPSKNMHVRLTGDSKLSLGVSVCVCVVVYLCVAL